MVDLDFSPAWRPFTSLHLACLVLSWELAWQHTFWVQFNYGLKQFAKFSSYLINCVSRRNLSLRAMIFGYGYCQFIADWYRLMCHSRVLGMHIENPTICILYLQSSFISSHSILWQLYVYHFITKTTRISCLQCIILFHFSTI